MQKYVVTNVNTVIATIRHMEGGCVVLELSGEIERFGDVSVEDVAAAHGFEVDDVIDDFTYSLTWL